MCPPWTRCLAGWLVGSPQMLVSPLSWAPRTVYTARCMQVRPQCHQHHQYSTNARHRLSGLSCVCVSPPVVSYAVYTGSVLKKVTSWWRIIGGPLIPQTIRHYGSPGCIQYSRIHTDVCHVWLSYLLLCVICLGTVDVICFDFVVVE